MEFGTLLCCLSNNVALPSVLCTVDPTNTVVSACPCQETQSWATAGVLSGCVSCSSNCTSCHPFDSSSCSVCAENYNYDGYSCIGCSSTCLSCSGPSSNQCLTCRPSDYLYENSTCIGHCDSPYFKVTEDGFNKCLTTCTKPRYLYSNGSCLPGCSFPYAQRIGSIISFCDYLCNSSYIITNGSCLATCPYPFRIVQGEMSYINYCKSPCYIETLYYYTIDRGCRPTCIYPFHPIQHDIYRSCYYVREPPISYIIDNLALVANPALLLITFFLPGDSYGIMVTVYARLFQYPRYFNLSFAGETKTMQETWTLRPITLDTGIKLPLSVRNKIPSATLPLNVAKYMVHSKFIVSFWHNLLCYTIVMPFICLRIAQRYMTKRGKTDKAYSIVVRGSQIIQNFLLVILYSSIGEILFDTILEFNKILASTPAAVISLILCVVFLIIVIVALVMHHRFLRQQQQVRKRDALEEVSPDLKDLVKQYPGIKVLYNDFKDKTYSQQGFLVFFVARDLLVSFVMGVLLNYPFYQAFLLSSLSAIMLIFMVATRPFKAFINEFQQYLWELLLVITTGISAVVSYLDSSETSYVTIREYLGIVVMCIYFIYNFSVLVFLLIKGLLALRRTQRARMTSQINAEQVERSHIQQQEFTGINHANEGISIRMPLYLIKDERSLRSRSTRTMRVKHQITVQIQDSEVKTSLIDFPQLLSWELIAQ